MSNEVIEHVAAQLRPPPESFDFNESQLPLNLQESYVRFLRLQDGGYTHDKFFHFFSRLDPPGYNLTSTNDLDPWKKYFDLDEKTFVFAEDIFGTQFCFDVRGNRRVVKMFRPYTGKMGVCANTFEDFLENEVLSEEFNGDIRKLSRRFFEETGQPFRPLTHISCKIPPSLGGSQDDLDNLELTDSIVNLRILGQLWQQLKHLRPGTRIKEVRVDRERGEITLIPA